MRQYILLRPVNAGNGRMRLGLATEDWHGLLGLQFREVFVELADNNESLAAIQTLRKYGSLTCPEINQWLQMRNYPLNEESLLFEFRLNNDRLTFVFIGRVFFE
ncbi:MAG: hypothetical protein IJP39_06250 [Bacteroidales bacterium]|nr:hypothetical protein [Bacteroidales bacterium]